MQTSASPYILSLHQEKIKRELPNILTKTTLKWHISHWYPNGWGQWVPHKHPHTLGGGMSAAPESCSSAHCPGLRAHNTSLKIKLNSLRTAWGNISTTPLNCWHWTEASSSYRFCYMFCYKTCLETDLCGQNNNLKINSNHFQSLLCIEVPPP